MVSFAKLLSHQWLIARLVQGLVSRRARKSLSALHVAALASGPSKFRAWSWLQLVKRAVELGLPFPKARGVASAMALAK